MARRLALVLVLVLSAAVPTASADLYSRKNAVDSRLATIQQRLAADRARQAALEGQVAAVTSQIRSLERQVGDVSARLSVLERDLALHRERLRRLTELFRLETKRLDFLRTQYTLAVRRLDRRLVAIYQTEDVSALDIVLSSSSFTEMIDQLDYVRNVNLQDKEIATSVHAAKTRVRAQRAETRKTRTAVASATRSIAVRTTQVRQVRDALLVRQGALSNARGQKQAALVSARAAVREEFAESTALESASASIAARIRAAEAAAAASAQSTRPVASSSGSSASAPTHVSAAGLIWPVSGPVVSTFGYRCLGGICRMHEGIDIGVPSGTPIHAAASGTVIFAGGESGYGNYTIVDHGNGIATAYAHQSSFAVGAGTHVSQGQVIGYSGCTGRCFGPHLHFEVRVHGSPVDPLGYL